MKVTQEMKSAVNAYLLARAAAETMRERIDAIAQELLDTSNYYVDETHLNRGRTKIERVTRPKDAWLMSDEEHHSYLSDLRYELEHKGLDIKGVPGKPYYHYYCPALELEGLQREAEKLVVDAAANMMGEKDFFHKLLCAGMDKYHQFVDLAVKAVVNYPGFKQPAI